MNKITDISERIKSLNPESGIFYSRESARITRISLKGADGDNLEFQVPQESSEPCRVYKDRHVSRFKQEELKDLCIAWLAIVAPEVLKFDD